MYCSGCHSATEVCHKSQAPDVHYIVTITYYIGSFAANDWLHIQLKESLVSVFPDSTVMCTLPSYCHSSRPQLPVHQQEQSNGRWRDFILSRSLCGGPPLKGWMSRYFQCQRQASELLQRRENGGAFDSTPQKECEYCST